MSLVIDLSRRVVETGSGVQLQFATDSDIFHLRVIALVAEKMKERAQVGDIDLYVPISEIEEQAWAFNAEKSRPYRSKGSMRENIYQTWRNRLPSKLDRCVGKAARSAKRSISLSRTQPEELFECAEGRGPDRAAYRIREEPEAIAIVPENESSNGVFGSGPRGDESRGLDEIFKCAEGATEEERIEQATAILMTVTDPQMYRASATASSKAVCSMLRDPELQRVDRQGRLAHPLEIYAAAFLTELGVTTKLPAVALVSSWLKELENDPWLHLMFGITEEESREDGFRRINDECFACGDLATLAWLFHRANVAASAAAHRDAILARLLEQDGIFIGDILLAVSRSRGVRENTGLDLKVEFRRLQRETMSVPRDIRGRLFKVKPLATVPKTG